VKKSGIFGILILVCCLTIASGVIGIMLKLLYWDLLRLIIGEGVLIFIPAVIVGTFMFSFPFVVIMKRFLNNKGVPESRHFFTILTVGILAIFLFEALFYPCDRSPGFGLVCLLK
jgi:hypothetical protein